MLGPDSPVDKCHGMDLLIAFVVKNIYRQTWAPSEDSDQIAHQMSLTTLCVLCRMNGIPRLLQRLSFLKGDNERRKLWKWFRHSY